MPATQEEQLDLLRRFEPVLVFAEGERFHPLAVEGYLARCDLLVRPRGWLRWLRRRKKVTSNWDGRATAAAAHAAVEGDGRARALADFDEHHYLWLLNPDARRAAAAETGGEEREKGMTWSRAIVLALVGFGCWKLWGTLPEGAARMFVVTPLASLALVAALVLWGRAVLTGRAAASLLRVLGAALVVTTVAGLVWWRGPGPVGVLVFVAIAGLMVTVLRDHLVVVYMELLSPLRAVASHQASHVEKLLRRGAEAGGYTYYGRVWDRGGPLVALQYSFFYAFNDWRHQGGLNLHEADWERAIVFLRRQGERLIPDSVWLSQHHRGKPRRWPEKVEGRSAPPSRDRVELANGHPVLYVAAGSHALYFDDRSRRLPDLIPGSWLRRFVDWSVEAGRSAEEGRDTWNTLVGGRRRRTLAEQMTEDDPDGRGLVIGPALPEDVEPERERAGWAPRLMSAEATPWIDYPGLWGRRTLLRNESGPPGPKWEREENLGWAERGVPRPRSSWENPAELAVPAAEESKRG